MIVRFDSLNRYETPAMTLCSPGCLYTDNSTLSHVVGAITHTSDEECIFNFNAPSELNFRIYKVKIDETEQQRYFDKVYNSIQNKRLIFVQDIGFFMIESSTTGYEDGLKFKDVKASSVEVEISNRNIPYIKDGTYEFKTLIDIITGSLPNWTLGTIAKGVLEKSRTFEDVDSELNCLDFMISQMQDAYECIFDFDIISRVINVYDQNDYIERTNIHLTKDDLINSLSYTEDANDLYTAISVIGGDDSVSIAGINPLGNNTIYNFDHYISWMSDSLGKKVTQWEKDIASAESNYVLKNKSIYTKLSLKSTHVLEKQRLTISKELFEKCKNNIIASSSTNIAKSYEDALKKNGSELTAEERAAIDLNKVDELKTLIEARILSIDTEIAQENLAITNINKDIKVLQDEVDAIRKSLQMHTYFTPEEYRELNNYIFEGKYSDEYIIITDIMDESQKLQQMHTLYNRAKNELRKISVPTQEFDVDTAGFIFDSKFKDWTSQLKTGCIVNIELEQDDVAPLFLAGITVNYEEHSMSMSFGNRLCKFDPKSLFGNVLGKIHKTANSVSYIKDILSPVKHGKLDQFEEAIKTSRNLTMDSALSSTGEEFIIDGAGCTARRKMDNGEYDPRQLKIIGKNIVFTNDAWETCSTAIGEMVITPPEGSSQSETVYGVNAEALIGQMILGNSLQILVGEQRIPILEAIDGKVTTHVESLESKLSADIKNNTDAIGKNTSSINQNTTDINKNTTEIGQHSADLLQHAIDIGNNTTNISNNTNNIETLNTETVQIKQDISDVTQTADQIQSNVTQLSQTIDDHATKIEQMGSQITQEADNIRAEVAGITIGGRNILTGTSQEHNATSPLYLISFPISEGSVGMISEGDPITVSFSIKINNNSTKVTSYAGGSRGDAQSEDIPIIEEIDIHKDIIDPQEGEEHDWSYYSYELIYSSSESPWACIAFKGESVDTTEPSFSVKEAKLEFGNKATTWVPALEDFDMRFSNTSQQLDEVSGKVETNSTVLTDLKTDASNLDREVASLSKSVADLNDKDFTLTFREYLISKDLLRDNGAGVVEKVPQDYVETSTGFRFDNQGLTITKSGTIENKMVETTIDNVGMIVKDTTGSTSSNLLKVTDEGVFTGDVSASGHLMIGDRSVFENYGSLRTGCYIL